MKRSIKDIFSRMILLYALAGALLLIALVEFIGVFFGPILPRLRRAG
jgi:hypothetical protein